MEKVKNDTEKDILLKTILENISYKEEMNKLNVQHAYYQSSCSHVALNIENSDFDRVDFKKCLLCGKILNFKDTTIREFNLKLYDKSVCEEYDNQVLEFKEILKTESDLESALTTYEWKLRDYNNSKVLKRTHK